MVKRILLVAVMVLVAHGDSIATIKKEYEVKINWAKKHPFEYSTPVSKRIEILKRERDLKIKSIKSKSEKVIAQNKANSKIRELQQQIRELKLKLTNLDIKLIKKIKKTNIKEFKEFYELCNSFENVKIRESGTFLECYINKSTYLRILERKLLDRDANRSKKVE